MGETTFPIRKNLRLQDYDYSSAGAYFLTVCLADRKPLLWNVGANTVRPYSEKFITPHPEAHTIATFSVLR